MAEVVKVTVQDYIATVVMDRPPVNAQSNQFREELIAAFDSFTDRDDVRVAILTGFGRMFSAGADMKERPTGENPGEYWKFNRLVREMFNSIHECAKPVIAAVNGPALGAGLGLAAHCDIILASDNAVFGMPEIDVGLAGRGGDAADSCSAIPAPAACSTPAGVSRPRSCIAPASSNAAFRWSS